MSDTTPRIRDMLLDQGQLLERLDRILSQDRLAHSYLFLGPAGSGRTRAALAFAQQLLCTEPGAPCGVCRDCRQTARLAHPDLHFLFPVVREDAERPERLAGLLEAYASDRYHRRVAAGSGSIGIDRIRALKEEVAKALVEGPRRVIILSGADQMTEQAAQSALKLVEEPPPDTVLILVAADSSRLLPTLVSRCQRISIRPLSSDRIEAILEELGVEREEAVLLASLSGGSLGRAVEMKEQQVLALRKKILAAFRIEEGRRLAATEVERRVQSLERGWTADTARLAVELLLNWHLQLVQGAAGTATGGPGKDLALSVEEIRRRVGILEEMSSDVSHNVNPVLALGAALQRIGGDGEDL